METINFEFTTIIVMYVPRGYALYPVQEHVSEECVILIVLDSGQAGHFVTLCYDDNVVPGVWRDCILL